MKRLAIVFAALALIGYAALGIHTIVAKQNMLNIKEVKLKSTTNELQTKQLQLEEINSKLKTELQKNDTDVQKQQELQNQIKELQAQLQAKADTKARNDALASKALNTVTGTATASAATPVAAGQGAMTGCGDNASAAFIYGMESGGQVSGHCNPSAVNGGGCRGIGQACPGGKLPCGADYACQNAWFNNYAIQRYGSWAAAESFWRGHNYW